MKKVFLAAMMAIASLSSVQLSAHADEQWFDRYDHDHDSHWNYNEFRKAHYDWYKHHHSEQRISDPELRHQFDGMAAGHPGWVEREQVRTYHNW